MNGYNFEDRHIARVLELIMKERESFMKVLKENNGCGLKKISSLMPSTTEEATKAVQDQVERYELSQEEVLQVGEKKLVPKKGLGMNNKHYDIGED